MPCSCPSCCVCDTHVYVPYARYWKCLARCVCYVRRLRLPDVYSLLLGSFPFARPRRSCLHPPARLSIPPSPNVPIPPRPPLPASLHLVDCTTTGRSFSSARWARRCQRKPSQTFSIWTPSHRRYTKRKRERERERERETETETVRQRVCVCVMVDIGVVYSLLVVALHHTV